MASQSSRNRHNWWLQGTLASRLKRIFPALRSRWICMLSWKYFTAWPKMRWFRSFGCCLKLFWSDYNNPGHCFQLCLTCVVLVLFLHYFLSYDTHIWKNKSHIIYTHYNNYPCGQPFNGHLTPFNGTLQQSSSIIEALTFATSRRMYAMTPETGAGFNARRVQLNHGDFNKRIWVWKSGTYHIPQNAMVYYHVSI